MQLCLSVLSLMLLFSCKTTTYYISRHAEKAGTIGSDPPLTTEGEKGALDLRNYLKRVQLAAVYATPFVRAKATAQPTSEAHHLALNLYNPAQSLSLIDSLKANNGRNVLIVGHSNTVDDMVNRLVGSAVLSDLPDTEYGSLFVVKKRGTHYRLQKITVPQTAPR